MRPPPASVGGSYTGPINDSSGGQGTLNLNIQQKNRKLRGTWSASFDGGDELSGTINGEATKKAIKVKLLTSDPKCHYHVIASVDGSELQGNMIASKRCQDDNSATFTIDKQ